ncbi:Aldo/keto reductase [Rhizodiscina lignyota]|uniref:Aldo/keto reductase n=1 Tax=Rhizodiscina lignyota TaxID=1504668 RepID=A0A9P4I4Z0_9PEZI|nr:Aldo/keto reductase [Rhizodiscina lignyota]
MVKVNDQEIGAVGYGLMGFTWRPDPTPFEVAFPAMRKSLELGANAWNGGEFYGTPDNNSMHLLNAYFTKYPEDAEKVQLCIKGASVYGRMQPDGSPQNVRRSIDECLKLLDGKKKIDLFECARVDHNTPYEQSLNTIAEYVKAGKVGGISLSEVSAATIRKAAKLHKIAAVEVEFSLMATDIMENGIAEACHEHNIPIFAYSPLCRGFLTSGWKKPEDVRPERLRIFPRFTGDAFYQNVKLRDEVERIAHDKAATIPQVALGWILAVSGKNGLPVIIPIPGATTAERVEENMKPAQLTDGDIKAINAILSKVTVAGTRYPEFGMSHTNG